MDVYMNNKLVSLNTSNYPWKAYINTILTSGTDEQKSQLQSQLFMKDSGDLVSTDGKNGANTELILRRDFIKNSREFEMEEPLFEDIFSLDRHLIQGVDLYIKLYRSSDQFLSFRDRPFPKRSLYTVMNGYELECALRSNSCIHRHVKGLFARNNLPTNKIHYPSAYIVNNHTSDLPGEHWMAIVLKVNLTGCFSTVLADHLNFMEKN
ncbi:unnamed protein product [Mytilus edulis]|uniref:Uncharacterized protein n=1 Tax=Mytilus edulis TaxID=6550 RepID=A0A8S3VBV0_MYTED|nr:unnamed protein product [Mytilus edulis]